MGNFIIRRENASLPRAIEVQWVTIGMTRLRPLGIHVRRGHDFCDSLYINSLLF